MTSGVIDSIDLVAQPDNSTLRNAGLITADDGSGPSLFILSNFKSQTGTDPAVGLKVSYYDTSFSNKGDRWAGNFKL